VAAHRGARSRGGTTPAVQSLRAAKSHEVPSLQDERSLAGKSLAAKSHEGPSLQDGRSLAERSLAERSLAERSLAGKSRDETTGVRSLRAGKSPAEKRLGETRSTALPTETILATGATRTAGPLSASGTSHASVTIAARLETGRRASTIAALPETLSTAPDGVETLASQPTTTS
jgi:hypothetical protein